MRVGRLQHLAIAAAGLLAPAGMALAADAGDAPMRRVLPLLPALITSSDGYLAVSAPPATLAYRVPVLTFADNFRRDLSRAVHLEFAVPPHPVVLALGDATNDTRVSGARVADLSGGARERIAIPDPEHADLGALRVSLGRAFLREWLRAAAPRDVPPAELPDWLAAGLARHVGGADRLADFEAVYEQWSRGRLPVAGDLLAFEVAAPVQYPSLQAVLAAWLLAQPNDGFATLMRRLAAGRAWSPAAVAEALWGHGDLVALDGAWDAWLAAAVRDIRVPGVTPPSAVRAFRAELLIYPGDYGIPLADAWRGRTFEECTVLPASAALRAAATDRALHIRLFAVGRDGTMQRVAAAYGEFLDALSQGKAAKVLQPLLAAAEDARRRMEQRVAAGESLRDPPADGAARRTRP